ncbi:MAG: transcription elongation factor GreA [Dehalococcoidia bacterium]
MTSPQNNISLGEVATRFLAALAPGAREASQQEVSRFTRWYGWDKPISQMAVPEVGNYAERVASTGVDVAKVLEPVRTFLTYVKKEGLTAANLGVHLRVKKAAPRSKSRAKIKWTAKAATRKTSTASLSSQGYAELQTELDNLRKERPHIADGLRLAAADKDFRENAPLDAMREYQGQTESRIRDLEAILESAVVVEHHTGALEVELGSIIQLRDLASGEDLRYSLVDPTEANLAQGKLSVASPVGQALLGKEPGQVVEVAAPVGTFRYQIVGIEP